MATELQSKPAAKQEVFVESQLAKAQQRLRAVDIARVLLYFAILSIGYFLASAVFDLMVGKNAGAWVGVVHWIGFLGYLGGAAFLLGILGTKLYRRINPYFAARELEKTIPNAKNSVVNWLDLREEKMAPSIRASLGNRAARDLKKTDVEQIVTSRSNYILSGILAGLLVGLLILFVQAPHIFGGLFQRAFLPFGNGPGISTTLITLLQPAEGNVNVVAGQKVEIRARIEGRVPHLNTPEAPTLQYRYNQNEPFARQPLELDLDGTWMFTLQKDRVHSGLWYKLTAGDAETQEFQIRVLTAPQVANFEVRYHYRPYLVRKDDSVAFPNQEAVKPRIKGEPGTEVTLLLHTNRALRDGLIYLNLAGKNLPIQGKILPDDPQAFQAQFTLEKIGTFQVVFNTPQGETNTDRDAYPIDVIPDDAPIVELTEPAKDVSLPANSTLLLEGFAKDEFGIKSVTLRLKLEGQNQPLAPKPYRADKPFKFDDGTYPDNLEYKDFIALDKLQNDKGQPFTLAKGMVVEYWLEAADNCDLTPTGNIGKSKSYKIKILEPDQGQKQKEDRKKAEQDQKEHQKQQDQKRKEDDLQHNPDKAKQELDKQREDLENQIKKSEELKKEADEKEKKDKQPGAAKPDEKNNGQPDNKDPKEKPGNNGQGQSKPAGDKNQQQPGDSKGPGDQKPSSAAKGNDQKQEGPQKGPDKGQAKDQGQNKQDKGQGAQAKPGNQGKGNPNNGPDKQEPRAENKPGKPDGKNNPGAQQPQAKPGQDKNAKGEPATAKNTPPNEKGAQPAAAKDQEGNTAQQQPMGADKREPTLDDLKKLADKIKDAKDRGDPGAKKAMDELTQAAQGAKDPQVKDEADKLLKEIAKNTQGNQKNPNRQPTPEDIKNLGDQIDKAIKNGDPKAAEDGLRKLDQAARNAHDPKVRDQADKKLDELAKQMPQPNADDLKNLTEKIEKGLEKGDPDAQKALQQLDRAAHHAQDSKIQQQAQQIIRDIAKKMPDQFPNPRGDDPLAKDPNEEFARRLQDMQLRKLQESVTPEMLKKAGLTEEQWKEFLQRAQAYEDLLGKVKPDPKKAQELRGGASQLPSIGPQAVKKGPNQVQDPLQGSRANIPPELREEYNLWTTGGKKK